MKHFEHLNFEKRKIINNKVSHNFSATEIADLIGCDPTAISKELKRNRYISKPAARNINDPICEKTLRFPYVCNGCPKKQHCQKQQYRYEATRAQRNADYLLVAPRKGIDLTQEEFNVLDKIVRDGYCQ